MGLITVIVMGVVLVPVSIILYFLVKERQNKAYFQKHGVPYVFGFLEFMAKMMFGPGDLVKLEEELYNRAVKTKKPLVGITDFGGNPNVYVMDLDIVRGIMVKDFDHFANRRAIGAAQSNKYFAKMLLATENDQWKGTRAKLSPTFTTGKLRKMFEIFEKSGVRMDAYIKDLIGFPNKRSMDIDFFQLFPKYSMDVIASCAFGIDSKSFEVKPEDKSVFEEMGTKYGFRFSGTQFFKILLVMGSPKIADFFNVSAMNWEAENYFNGVVREVIKHRRQTGERRDDFLQLMLDAQAGLLKEDEESKLVMNGSVAGEEAKGSMEAGKDIKLGFDDDAIIANGLQFLIAGFDTTQTAMVFTLYGLAREQDVQEKLYQEIKGVLAKNGGRLDYDAITEMKYLDMVLNESLRFYNPTTRTERRCNERYPVPGTNFVIEKGAIVIIPQHGIHHDPRNFTDPYKFDPDRFLPENKAKLHPYAFMPFGHGPRNCIGMRFALIKVRAIIAQLVYTYKFAPCARTKIPMEFDRHPTIKPKEYVWLNATVREN